MIGSLIDLADGALGRWQQRRAAKAASAARIEEKRADLELARMDAEIRRASDAAAGDTDYDLQVLRNRERSRADEVLIGIFAGIFILPFVDALVAVATGYRLGLADAVADGWAAHGYDGAAWWFEFAMVGILVSTLGLFRLLRMWRGGRGAAPAVKGDHAGAG